MFKLIARRLRAEEDLAQQLILNPPLCVVLDVQQEAGLVEDPGGNVKRQGLVEHRVAVWFYDGRFLFFELSSRVEQNHFHVGIFKSEKQKLIEKEETGLKTK